VSSFKEVIIACGIHELTLEQFENSDATNVRELPISLVDVNLNPLERK
jgi:hypothetical protein